MRASSSSHLGRVAISLVATGLIDINQVRGPKRPRAAESGSRDYGFGGDRGAGGAFSKSKRLGFVAAAMPRSSSGAQGHQAGNDTAPSTPRIGRTATAFTAAC